MDTNIKRQLRLLLGICIVIILPLVGLIIGAFSPFGIGIGMLGGTLVGIGIYLLMIRRYVQFKKAIVLYVGLTLVVCVAYNIFIGNLDWPYSIMLACISVVLTTAPQVIHDVPVAARTPVSSPNGADWTPTAAVKGEDMAALPVNRKRNTVIIIVVIGIFVAISIFVIVSKLNPPSPTTPEDVANLYQQTNPTHSTNGITFPIQPDWIAIDGMDGAFKNKDSTAIFALNGISQLGSSTPEEAFQEIYDIFSKSYKVTSNPVIASYTTSDGIQCRTGNVEMEKDSSTYVYVKVVIAPQKNMVISFIGQRNINDTRTDAVSPASKMASGLTFQVADHDMVSGNAFVSQGDGSQLCLKEDGSFYYYAMADDHSQKYYIGTYESYYGQAAFDKIVSMTEYGLTAEELERTHTANMNGYIPGGSSPNDYLYALDPTMEDNRPRYQVCTDSFYALILHNDKIVMSKDDVQDSGNSTLYIGYYIPELKLLDLLNTNVARQYSFEFEGRTADMDAEPTT